VVLVVELVLELVLEHLERPIRDIEVETQAELGLQFMQQLVVEVLVLLEATHQVLQVEMVVLV
jgi:hypothetical protein